MGYISFNYYTISLLLGGFTAVISGLVVLLQDRKRLDNQAWFALTISTAIWSFGYFFMTVSETESGAVLSNKILHYAAIFIPLFYYLLVLIITGTFKKYRSLFYCALVIAMGFELATASPLFLAGVTPKVGFNFAPVPGPWYFYFFVYFVALVLAGIFTTTAVIHRTEKKSERLRLLYTIIFTIAASVGGGSVFLTTFFYNIPPYFLILFSIYPAISGYAILRHQLFDTKVITTQILTFGLWTFILIRALIAETIREQIIGVGLLLITVVLGTLLIRNVFREVQTREKIEKLALDLEEANERLQELDKLKSEFVSLATHQIRGPLTAIKGYASLMIEGDYGEVPEKLKEPIDTIFTSSQSLAVVVDDFLNVSRIEQGRMRYDFTNFDLCNLVNEVVSEAKPNIEKKGLSVSSTVCLEPVIVNGDIGKIKQVIGNILDNSVKYTPSGGITLSLVQNVDLKKATLSIKDTGVGIRPGTVSHLFQKFSRAEDASKFNILGTGLGLYVAKEMMKAHGGRIWVESPGEGKGSTFFVELATV